MDVRNETPKYGPAILLLAAVALGMLGLLAYYRVAGSGSFDAGPVAYLRTPLDPVRIDGRIVGRVATQLPDAQCIVLRYPMQFPTPEARLDVEKGDPNRDDDDLELLVIDPNNRWYVDPNHPEQLTTFNCATFALGEKIGLTRSDWLETVSTDWTNDTCPTQVVLDCFYTIHAVYSADDLDCRTLDTSDGLNTGDIITFVKRGHSVNHIHLCLVQKVGKRNLLIGKLTTGPIVSGTFCATFQHYRVLFDEVRIYRERPDRKSI